MTDDSSASRPDADAASDGADEVEFRRVRFGPGYDRHEVDEFCRRALAELAREPRMRTMTAEAVEAERFTTRWLGGYDQSEVDEFLERVGSTLAFGVAGGR